MIFKGQGYASFIEENLMIINKEQQPVPFLLNPIQYKYLIEDATGRDVILKARQQGFSSVILAIFTADFILKDNTRSVIVADKADNATELLDRVKFYIRAYEEKNNITLPLKYNSKYELFNEFNGSRYTIGTAENKEIGRSKTVTNLHLSEFAYYPDAEKLFAGIMQAVVPEGKVIIETTARGFNYFKEFWGECVNKVRPFKPLFYPASDFYTRNALDIKRRELGRLFDQEYPETPEDSFLTSGDLYFDSKALREYLAGCTNPLKKGIYV